MKFAKAAAVGVILLSVIAAASIHGAAAGSTHSRDLRAIFVANFNDLAPYPLPYKLLLVACDGPSDDT